MGAGVLFRGKTGHKRVRKLKESNSVDGDIRNINY